MVGILCHKGLNRKGNTYNLNSDRSYQIKTKDDITAYYRQISGVIDITPVMSVQTAVIMNAFRKNKVNKPMVSSKD